MIIKKINKIYDNLEEERHRMWWNVWIPNHEICPFKHLAGLRREQCHIRDMVSPILRNW